MGHIALLTCGQEAFLKGEVLSPASSTPRGPALLGRNPLATDRSSCTLSSPPTYPAQPKAVCLTQHGRANASYGLHWASRHQKVNALPQRPLSDATLSLRRRCPSSRQRPVPPHPVPLTPSLLTFSRSSFHQLTPLLHFPPPTNAFTLQPTLIQFPSPTPSNLLFQGHQ